MVEELETVGDVRREEDEEGVVNDGKGDVPLMDGDGSRLVGEVRPVIGIGSSKLP